jgi:hemerythrin-like domain-containing protein
MNLAQALEHEHHEIDDGIEAFLAGLRSGDSGREPLERAMVALRRHIYLEEEFLFPPLRDAGLFAPIFVMLREHGEIWDTLEALETELARDPSGAASELACRTLMEQLASHNAKEEPILYPQADATLAADTAQRLQEFIAAGAMPDGWVCARAGT